MKQKDEEYSDQSKLMKTALVEKAMADSEQRNIQKQLDLSERRADERQEELDRLYLENDRYKDEMNKINNNFDLEGFQKNLHALEAFDAWAKDAVKMQKNICKQTEIVFGCGIC